MAVHIRLTRLGSNKKPFYRIVVSDSRVKRDGKYLEQIGIYDSLNDSTKIDKDLALKWLNNGAIPTDTVRNILSKHGVMKEFAEEKDKRRAELNKSKKIKDAPKKTSSANTKKKATTKTKKSSSVKAESVKTSKAN